MAKIISKNDLELNTLKNRLNGEVKPINTEPDDLMYAFNTYFKPACEDIGKLIGKEDFKGGFDEIPLLYTFLLNIDSSTEEGKMKILNAHTLAIRWEAADAYCKHESEKLRWKPAQWWKYCWEQDNK